MLAAADTCVFAFLGGRVSRWDVTWTAIRSPGPISISPVVQNNELSPERCPTVLPPPSPLPGSSQVENHRRSLRPWITDYRLRLRTSHTSPLLHPHRLQTTRPTTMTSSTDIPQIIPRTRATKLSTFIHRTSPMPQAPSTAEARPSLSTTRASLPFPINQYGTTLRLRPCRPLRRNRRGHFGRRFYSIPQSANNVLILL